MRLLPPALLQRLARTKLQVKHSAATGGAGERRSKAVGVGIEFADHRPYQPGDDIRHLDRHVFDRLGAHHVREFSAYQQLPVTVLLDASASMGTGLPTKFQLARMVAAGLAYVSLAGNDRVQVGVCADGRVDWYKSINSIRRAPALFEWMLRPVPNGASSLLSVAHRAADRLFPGGLLILVSDMMVSDLASAFRVFRQVEQEIVVIHIVAPDEVDPAILGADNATLVDSETGHEVDIAIDAAALNQYRDGFRAWRDERQAVVRQHRGRYFQVMSDAPLERVLLHDLRVAGLIR